MISIHFSPWAIPFALMIVLYTRLFPSDWPQTEYEKEETSVRWWIGVQFVWLVFFVAMWMRDKLR